MTEEPYRWLEAVENRREYVRTQMGNGTPVLAAALEEGVLLIGVGAGQTKVFEVFDRQAMAGLGHPADIEKVRQMTIDMAHVEAFARAPEDVGLRRLVGFGLGPQLKAHFDQIYAAPYLVELLFAEVGPRAGEDVFMRLHFDGSFEAVGGRCALAAADPAGEAAVAAWVNRELAADADRVRAAAVLMQAWGGLMDRRTFDDTLPAEAERVAGWRAALGGRTIEAGWLSRAAGAGARFEPLSAAELGL